MKKKHNILQGIKPAVLGLAFMALVYAGAAALRIPGIDNKFEFAGVAGLCVAWLPVIYGTFLIRREAPSFNTAFMLAVSGLLASVLEGGLAAWRFLGGMGEQTFLQIEVLFAGYLALLAMFGVFAALLKGVAAWGAVDKENPKADWKAGFVAALVLVMAATLFLPLASMFDGTIKLAAFAGAILIILLSELYLCWAVSRGAKPLAAKSQ